MIVRSICYFKTRGERRVIREEDRVQVRCEESGGKKVEIFICERENLKLAFDSLIF